MKIAITGHTSGIGQAIFNKLINTYTVTGYSLDNSYDIGKITDRKKILNDIKDYDIFINNAWHFSGQIEMLKDIVNSWKDQNKLIINIGSTVIGDHTEVEDVKYIASKKKLNEKVHAYSLQNPNISNILLNWVDTPLISKYTNKTMLSVEHVSTVINFIIENKSKVWIKEIILDSPIREES